VLPLVSREDRAAFLMYGGHSDPARLPSCPVRRMPVRCVSDVHFARSPSRVAMSRRTKLGRAVAQASTRQALEAELSEACGVAKNAKTDDAYDEAHSWIDDVLTELDKMSGPKR
jgi:hypothetical protein